MPPHETPPQRDSLLRGINREFADYVEWLCEGWKSRELDRVTGVNYQTITEMRRGKIPTFPILKRFVDGFAAVPGSRATEARNRYELFKKAGYTMDGSPTERLLEWQNDFQKRIGRPIELHFANGIDGVTHEEAEALIEFHEDRAKRLGWLPAAPAENQPEYGR